MKNKKTFILIGSLVAIIGGFVVYLGSPGGEPVGREASGEAVKSPPVSAEGNRSAESAVGVPTSVDTESVVAGGTDEGAASAPAREGALVDAQRKTPLLASGEKAAARVVVDGRSTDELKANELGEFPRVYVRPLQKVSVNVSFPEAAAGSRVVAQVEDGGQFADGKPVAVLTLDAKREASLEFTLGEEPGHYRIALRRGPDWKYVQLWAEQKETAAR
jgi:hypothetical protein